MPVTRILFPFGIDLKQPEADGATDAVEIIDYPLLEAIELARRTGGGKWLPYDSRFQSLVG